MKRVLSALAAVLALGTVGYFIIEKMAFPDAFLSAVSVMATVGVPAGLSTGGKLFTAILIMSSIGLVIAAIARLVIKPPEEEELLTGFFRPGSGSERMIMKEVKVSGSSPLSGLSKAQVLQNHGLVVVGLKSKTGFDVDIPLKAKVKSGSSVLLLGSPAALLGIERKKN